MAFRIFDSPTEGWVVRCKGCDRTTAVAARKRGAPPPAETVIVQCHLCGEKRRYLPTEVYLGTAAGGQSFKEHGHPRKVAVVFIPRNGFWIYCLADDLKTVVSPHMLVRRQATLRNLLRYVGATPQELEQFDLAVHSWGQGSTMITLQPGKRNLLKVHKDYFPWSKDGTE